MSGFDRPLTLEQLDRLGATNLVIEYVQDGVRLPARYCGVTAEISQYGKKWYIFRQRGSAARLLASQYGKHWLAYAVRPEEI